MSSVQSLIIIAIIILIILLVAAVLVMNHRQLHQIETIDQAIAEIDQMHLERAIDRLDKMDLAGESLTTLNTWRKNYRLSSTQKIPHVQQLIEKAADQNTSYHLLKAHRNIKQAQAIIRPALEDAHNTKDVFAELLESNRENKLQYDSLIKTYHQMRKTVLADSFNYGTALDQIENRLTKMEGNFEEAKNLSAQGDHVEVKRVLTKIKIDLKNLRTVLPKVQTAQHQLATVFQDQLNELSSTYKKMVEEKYYIDKVDVLAEIKKINTQVEQARELLAHLKVDELAKVNKRIAQQIDSLYQVLGKEFKARPFVEKNRSKVFILISHQQTVSKQLVAKMEHIDESYELTHGELKESRHLKKEVDDMSHRYTIQTQSITDGKGVYSKIQASWLEMLERLKKIDEEQKTMSKDVDGLYDSEHVANDSINRFKQEVALVYRRLQRRHLPGNPDSFVQMYTLVVNEIGHVSDELNQVRINMEKISNELIQISDDVERLKREAEEIINSANLVELTVQYSNKYAKNEQIQKAQRHAEELFQDKYDYQKALDTIATAIEKVEPGAYQRLENAYYSEENN